MRRGVALLCALVQASYGFRLEGTQPNQVHLQSDPFAPLPVTTLSVTHFGALGNGVNYDTEAFHAGISALTQLGGGTLHVPSGTYLVTTLTLASNISLHLDHGATLLSSNLTADWAMPHTRHVLRRQCGGVQDKVFYGGPVIFCFNCTNVAVTGAGVVDGQGHKWWAMTSIGRRGYLLLFVGCVNVLIQGVTFQVFNDIFWSIFGSLFNRFHTLFPVLPLLIPTRSTRTLLPGTSCQSSVTM